MTDVLSPRARILIVDDAVFVRRHLRDLLEKAGYEVVAEAEDGAEALALYDTHHPDLVTMDVVMPRMTGIEALRELRANHREARVVICSSLSDEPSIIEAIGLGARDYVLKPVKESRFLDAVEKALR
jgi:two-component system chemotaxis response regulator CheY